MTCRQCRRAVAPKYGFRTCVLFLSGFKEKNTLRACLHGGGGPQVGEATRLAVIEKWPAFTWKLTTPGSRGDVTGRCCVVARHVNREIGGPTTHFGGQCSFPLIISSRCNISVLWLLLSLFIIQSLRLRQLTVTWTRPRLGGLPHLESFTWQNATPADRVTVPGRPGNPPRQVTRIMCTIGGLSRCIDRHIDRLSVDSRPTIDRLSVASRSMYWPIVDR